MSCIVYSMLLLSLLYQLQVITHGFFIKHQATGFCLIARKEVFSEGKTWGKVYLMDLQDKCFDERAQFWFLSSGAMYNNNAKGCVSALLKWHISLKIALFMYQPVPTNYDEACGSRQALTQTKEHGLLYRDFYEAHYFKVKSNLCAKRSYYHKTKELPYDVHLSEMIYACDGEDQVYNFGDVTCDGATLVNVSCPKEQVMNIIKAHYGGHSKLCGHEENTDCIVDVTCSLKHHCDELRSCHAVVNSSLVGDKDPCPGKKKSLLFEYQCMNKTYSHADETYSCYNSILNDPSNIQDTSFYASSYEANFDASKARFSSNTSWCALCTNNSYLQVDLKKEYFIEKVATLGDKTTKSWVGTYRLNYSTDYINWKEATNQGNKVFQGNDVRLEHIGITRNVSSIVRARVLRFIPVSFYKKACMRVEICGIAVLPGKARNLEIINITSRRVTFSWSAPSEKTDAETIITGYRINILTGKTTIHNETINKLNSSMELIPNTDYTMSIAARNKYGIGGKILQNFRTLEDVPDDAPLNIKIVTINSTSLQVSWTEPNKRKQNGIIVKYSVCVQIIGDCDIIERSKITTLILGSLLPSTWYTIKVKAATKIGFGPYSKEIKQQTNIEPSAPSDNATTTTLHFSLSKPSNGNISFYLIIAVKLRDNKIPDRPMREYTDYKSYNEAHDINEPYVAANLTGDVVSSFVLGEKSRKKRRSLSYYNGPLDPDSFYSIFQRFYYQGGYFISSDWSSPTKTVSLVSPKPTDPVSSNNDTLLIILVCVLVIVCLIIVAIIVLAFKRRAKKRRTPAQDNFASAVTNEAISVKYENQQTNQDAVEIYDENMSKNEENDNASEEVVDEDKRTGGGVEGAYANKEEIILQKTNEDIPIEKLEEHIKLIKHDGRIKKEFEELPFGERYSCTTSKQPFNKDKNRYKNTNAYDHSRVELSGGDGNDYINASYINGITENYYIATQGPKPSTIDDFWRLIFEHRCPTIVMLTTLKEMGKVKCEKYWPDESNMYGQIEVTNNETKAYADFVIRTFSLKKKGEIHTTKQFHFTSWPDYGVPKHATQFLTFRSNVQTHHQSQQGPEVVHCSAGVGRTGVFIAIDRIMNDIDQKNSKTLNIYDLVKDMRTRRVNMVQVVNQYVFIYDTLLDYIKCGMNEVEPENLVIEMRKLSQVNQNGDTGFKQSFKRLNDVSPQLNPEECESGLSKENKLKNRFASIYPSELSRVFLTKIGGDNNSDYINACFVDGYLGTNFFIATQTPLDETILDLWRMVIEKKCSTIVMLNQLRESDQEYPMFWPAQKSESYLYGSVNVTLISAEKDENIVTRKFDVSDDSETRSVRLLGLLTWPDHGVPENVDDILSLLLRVAESQRTKTDSGPIIVMCSDGAGRTGTYIAISNLVERVKTEQSIDVFQAIKLIRNSRPQFVENEVQYEFCYTVIDKLLKSFSEYSNFQAL